MDYIILKDIVDGIKGTTFSSIDTVSEVKLKGGKKNPFQNRVTKKTIGSQVILSNTAESVYANMVKKRLVEEGKEYEKFELKARTWGVREGDTCIIDHNGVKYLEVIFIRGGKSTYYVDDVETDPAEIEGLEIETKVNEESQGGLEDKVVIRTYKVDSIMAIRHKKETYIA